jgi:hypothetical protein
MHGAKDTISLTDGIDLRFHAIDCRIYLNVLESKT